MRIVYLLLVLVLSTFMLSCTPTESAREGVASLVAADADELLEVLTGSGAELSVVNFWATWCVPCKAEFPDLIKAGKEFEDKGVQMIFVSTDFEDQESSIRSFLEEQNVPWRSFIKKGDSFEFIQSFHEEWLGGLPTTLFFDSDGLLIDYWEGISNYEEVRSKIESYLDR